jgi:hypothetical protein
VAVGRQVKVFDRLVVAGLQLEDLKFCSLPSKRP